MNIDLTIDSIILERAKELALMKNICLSFLVETLLIDELGISTTSKKLSFIHKWTGRLNLRSPDGRFAYLQQCYEI